MSSESFDKLKFDKANSKAIYAYAVGLFGLVVISSQKSFGMVLDWPQMMGLGFVLVLLLYRYFDFIKLGGFLELQKKFEKSEKQLAIAQNELNDLTDTELLREESTMEEKSESEQETESSESKDTMQEKSTKSTKLLERIPSVKENGLDKIPEEPSDDQTNHALRLLRDRRWKWRTNKTLMRRTKMTQKQFNRFLDNHPEVVESYIDDVSGNKLYRIED